MGMDGNGRLGACAGEDGKARGDDAAHDHVGGHGGAHLHETHAHKLDGGTRGEAGRRVTEQDADDGGRDERLLKVEAAEQA